MFFCFFFLVADDQAYYQEPKCKVVGICKEQELEYVHHMHHYGLWMCRPALFLVF